MYGVQAETLAYKRTRKAHLLFQHGRDIHYSLIDGDI
jgi:hypothetical protein